MIPALANFIFPSTKGPSPAKSEDDSQRLTEPHLHDEAESVVSSSLNVSSYASLKKDELVAIASKAGIRLDKKATKSQIVRLLATNAVSTTLSSQADPQSMDSNVSVTEETSVAATPIRKRGRSSFASKSDLGIASSVPSSTTKSSPARTRSSLASKASAPTRTPASRKSQLLHELRSPKEVRASHEKTLDPQYEYYNAVDTGSKDQLELRSPKELLRSHQKALDPQFEYYASGEVASLSGRVTRSSRKSAPARAPSRSPSTRRRSGSISSQKAASKSSATQSATEESENESNKPGRRQSRRSSARSTSNSTQSSPLKTPGRRRASATKEPAIPESAGSKRKATTARLPAKKSRKEEVQTSSTIDSEVDEEGHVIEEPQQTVHEEAPESTGNDMDVDGDNNEQQHASTEESNRAEQEMLNFLTNVSETEQRHHSEQSSTHNEDEEQIDGESSAEDDHGEQGEGEEEEAESNDSNDEDENFVDDANAMDEQQDHEALDEDDDQGDELPADVDADADEIDQSDDSEEEGDDSNGDESDGDDYSVDEDDEGEADAAEEEEEQPVAPTAYNFPANGFMAAFLAAGHNASSKASSDVMDLVSDDSDEDDSDEEDDDDDDDDEEGEDAEAESEPEPEPEPVQTKPVKKAMFSFAAPTTTAVSFAPKEAVKPVAVETVKTTEQPAVAENTNPNTNPKPLNALEAFNKLGSKLITAAVAAESQVTEVPKLSTEEYDLIKSILNKIKPAQASNDDEEDEQAVPGQKRALKKSVETEPVVEEIDLSRDEETGQESAMKRRRTSTDSRVSYDGGEAWNFSHPGEDPLSPPGGHTRFGTASNRNSGANLFGRSSFGSGNLFGRVQTPYNHTYRPSIGSVTDSGAVSASKLMFDRRIEEAAVGLPTPSVVGTEVKKAANTTQPTLSASKITSATAPSVSSTAVVVGSGGRSSYTPQFRSSASFLPSTVSSSSSRDNLALVAAEESSLSYLEKRRLKRQMEASASASVAKQIMDTLGSLSSPLEPAAAPVGLLPQEANMLKFGTSKVPDFQSKLDKNSNANTTASNTNSSGSSSSNNNNNATTASKAAGSVSFASSMFDAASTAATTEKKSVSFQSDNKPTTTTIAPSAATATSKVSFALSTKIDDEDTSSKSSKFYAPPTPMPTTSFAFGAQSSTASDRHVQFATEPVTKAATAPKPAIPLTPAASHRPGSQKSDEDFDLDGDDDDNVIVVEKKRSSIGSTPYRPGFATSSSPMDADEFSFDEPLVVKGVDTEFAERESVADIRYAFTPPSKKRRPATKTMSVSFAGATPAAKSTGTKDTTTATSSATAGASSNTAAPATSIWNMKKNPDEKKCQTCLVMNDKAAVKCESCGTAFPASAAAASTTAPAASASASASASGAPATSIWNMKKNPDEKKCQTCLVMNDKAAVKCESCGTAFPAAAATAAPAVSATTAASAATAAATIAPSSSSSFTFGATPVSAPAASKFTFGVTPADTSKKPQPEGGAPFGSGVSFAPPLSTSETKKKDDSNNEKPAAAFTFGQPAESKAAVTLDAKAPFTGFSFGSAAAPAAAPAKPEEKKPEEKKPSDEAPKKDDAVAAKPAFTFGAPATATTAPATTTSSSNSNPFGVAAAPAAGGAATFVFGAAPAAKLPEPAKKEETAAPAPFSFGAPAPATTAAVPTEAPAATKPSFSFGASSMTFGAAPAAAAAAAAADAKPAAPAAGIFGSAPAPAVVATAPLPSFGGSSTSFGAPAAAAEKKVDAPLPSPFGAFNAPPTVAVKTDSLPPLGSAGTSFNAFAPKPAASTAAPTTTVNPFGAAAAPVAVKPAETQQPFGGFGSAASTVPATTSSASSNPFVSSFGATPAVTSAASNPFAAANTAATNPASAVVPGLPTLPSSTGPFGGSAPVFGAAAPASASNPFAASFGASAAPAAAPSGFAAAATAGGAAPATSGPFSAPFGPSTSSTNLFGAAPAAAPAVAASNPFASSFGGPSAAAVAPSASPAFAFGGSVPAAPSLTPQTSFGSTNPFGGAPQQLNNALGGSGGFGGNVANPMAAPASSGGFSLGASGPTSGAAGGQPRKILKIKKKVP